MREEMHMRIIGIAVLLCSIATFAFGVEPVVTGKSVAHFFEKI